MSSMSFKQFALTLMDEDEYEEYIECGVSEDDDIVDQYRDYLTFHDDVHDDDEECDNA